MKNKRAISLIVLIITIIVMIILSGTVIISLNGGIFEKANEATLNIEIASEKEALRLAGAIAIGDSKIRRITVDGMQRAMDKVTDVGTTTVIDNGDTLAVRFNRTNKYYEISTSGEVLGTLEVKTDSTPGVLHGTGTDPFVIMSIEDLMYFSREVNTNKNTYSNKYVVLGTTLDFKSDLSYVNPNTKEYDVDLGGDGTIGLKQQLTTGLGFKPIGISATYCFKGNLDGQNNAIKNIKIDVEGYAGLFSYKHSGLYKT